MTRMEKTIMTVKAISQRNDIENYNAKLSKTGMQKRRIDNVKEGFLVNNFVKDSISNNKIVIGEQFIIPEKTKIDSEFKNNKTDVEKFFSKIVENPIMPIGLATVGVLGGVALASKILYSNAKLNLKISKLDRLPDLPRNMNLNSENDFVTYMAVQNPNIKTILGAFATISFAGAVFVVKNFIDGFKDIWVKKQDANIQRNLQESLIEVETKSFAGKNNIIRNLMREKAEEMQNLAKISISKKSHVPAVFQGFLSFKGTAVKGKDSNSSKIYPLVYSALGVLTIGLSAFFTHRTVSNIRAIGKEISVYNSKMHANVDKILNNTSKELLSENKNTLLDIFSVLNFKPEYVKEKLAGAGFSQKDIAEFIVKLEKRYRVFVDAPEALGGKQGIQYYSYIDDVQGHLYNWLMNCGNASTGQFTKNLFFSLAIVAGLGYVGKTAVEAVKDVQVKKVNAQTDLNLHKKLVDVELRNFETKKRTNIDVLLTEFTRTVKSCGDKEKLENMANDILFEIKNGAPFVYS